MAGLDYSPISDRLIRWRANAVDPEDNGPPFTITIIDDNDSEDTEYFEVFFMVETIGYAYPDSVARITILDGDGGNGGRGRREGGRKWEGGRGRYNVLFYLPLPSSAPTCNLSLTQYTVIEGSPRSFIDITVLTTGASSCLLTTEPISAAPSK